MNPIQTGIGVALALVVVGTLILFPGISPFRFTNSIQEATSTPISLTQSASSSPTTQTANTQTAMNSIPPNSTSLQITDEVVGTGATAQKGDTVTVNYVGSLTNGTVFDASANHGSQGFTFSLGAGQVIQGWDQGIVGMKEGGKRRLVVPAALAYGPRAVGNVIPANATLVFEVQLLKVQKKAQ